MKEFGIELSMDLKTLSSLSSSWPIEFKLFYSEFSPKCAVSEFFLSFEVKSV